MSGISPPIEFRMVHTCTISRVVQDQRLYFVSGSAALVGQSVTGLTSHATGEIKSLVINSGSWVEGNASGYVILSNVSGEFQDGEIIEDNQVESGEAVVSGSLIPVTDDFGTPSLTTISTPSKCLFTEPDNTGFGGLAFFEISGGKYLTEELLAFLPSGVDVREGDKITGLSAGYTREYEVFHISTPMMMYSTSIAHKEAKLRIIEKRRL